MKLGLIAGNRRYPIIFAKEAKTKASVYITAAAFKGETSPGLADYVDEIHWIRVGQLGELIRIFKNKGISEAVMIGQINPIRLFKKNKLDQRARDILSNIRQMSAETIFSRLADELEKEGIILKDARLFLERLLAQKGAISAGNISDTEKIDIEFGVSIAKKAASLNIGQSVVVKNKTVVAVEGIEGTDSTIRRAGRITGGDIIVVKVSRPEQDMRFDVPVVGPGTIKRMKKAGGGILAIESGKVLILDKEETIRLAEKYRIRIVGV